MTFIRFRHYLHARAQSLASSLIRKRSLFQSIFLLLSSEKLGVAGMMLIYPSSLTSEGVHSLPMAFLRCIIMFASPLFMSSSLKLLISSINAPVSTSASMLHLVGRGGGESFLCLKILSSYVNISWSSIPILLELGLCHNRF